MALSYIIPSGYTTDMLFNRMDIHEDGEKNLVTATFELPGLKKEDVSIEIHNNRLVVSGETTFSKDTNEDGYIVKQRRRGKFSRMVPLPQGTQVSSHRINPRHLEYDADGYLQVEQIKASMENGVLTVSFPKSSPEQAAKKITIA